MPQPHPMTQELTTPAVRSPSSPRRRVLLIGGGLAAAGVAGAWGYVATHRHHALEAAAFANMPSALRTLDGLRSVPMRTRSGWDLAHVLHHVAQSVEYSLDGFPQLKPAWFRESLGSAAFAVFSARGKMSHGLAEPIPGAAPIEDRQTLNGTVDHAIAALTRFDNHVGPYAPHFAYGLLDKGDYARAHLMHLANHWELVDALTAIA